MPSRTDVRSIYLNYRRHVSQNPTTKEEMRDWLIAELVRKVFMFE